MPNRYKVGQVARCTGTFKDEDDVVQDPTAVFFHLIDPSENEITLEYGVDGTLVKASTGVYYVDVAADEAGIFAYRFYSTGTYVTADEDQFEVVASGHV
jgi:hypothetical protein